MKWEDLQPGDVVVPGASCGHPWLVLSRDDDGLWYADLVTTTMSLDCRGFGGRFDPSVMILRDGQDVNR